MKLFLVFILIFLAACTSPRKEEKYQNLRNHASFDLRCPAENIGVEYVDDDKYRVNGCGRVTTLKVDDGKVK